MLVKSLETGQFLNLKVVSFKILIRTTPDVNLNYGHIFESTFFFWFKVTRTLAITGVMRVENAARPRSVVFLTLAQITQPAPIFVEKKPDSIFRTFLALAKKVSPMNLTLRAVVMKINVKKIPAQTMRLAVFVEHFFEN